MRSTDREVYWVPLSMKSAATTWHAHFSLTSSFQCPTWLPTSVHLSSFLEPLLMAILNKFTSRQIWQLYCYPGRPPHCIALLYMMYPQYQRKLNHFYMLLNFGTVAGLKTLCGKLCCFSKQKLITVTMHMYWSYNQPISIVHIFDTMKNSKWCRQALLPL